MKVVVVGGTGFIGKKLVADLTGLGHEVVAASPSKGINALTGEGLEDAIKGAEVVVDVTNAGTFDEKEVMEFFTKTTQNQLAAEKAAGTVKHHIALSIVGAHRLADNNSYMKAKVAQEDLVAASGIPYTIVRATQFFEFAPGIADASTEGQLVLLPDAFIQPILSDDVAAGLVENVLGEPANAIVELAGPVKLPISEFISKSLAAANDSREVVIEDRGQYFYTKVEKDSLVPIGENKARTAPTHLEDWLAHK